MKRDDAAFASVLLGAVVFAGICVRQIVASHRAEAAPLSFRLPVGTTRQDVLGNHSHVEGTPDAPVTLVEFGDYQCPPCRRDYDALRQMLPHAQGRWNLAFRHFPLTGIHPYAYDAAVLAEAAGEQGCFWEMHDLLYQHNTALQPTHFGEYARSLHLDAERLEAARRASAKRQVDLDVAAGNYFKIPGTPCFVLVDQAGKASPISLAQFRSRFP